MTDEWEQIGTVEVLRLRIYPIDPLGEQSPLRTTMTRDEFDAQTGGLHPAEICGSDCSGCCDDWEWK